MKIGSYQKLIIVKNLPDCFILQSTDERYRDEIYLKKTQSSENFKIGNIIEVFVYKNSKLELTATLTKPVAVAGELAYLKVVSSIATGAFLDWNFDSHLFLPKREQKYKILPEKKYLVAIILDKKERMCATTEISEFLQSENPYSKNDKVSGTIYKIVEGIGALTAVDNKYFGLIPEIECYGNLNTGDIINARVIRKREDNKLDLSLRELSHIQMDSDAIMLIHRLKSNNDFLPYNDETDSEIIKNKLNMSKKAFKRAIGKLLKTKQISFFENGIKINGNIYP